MRGTCREHQGGGTLMMSRMGRQIVRQPIEVCKRFSQCREMLHDEDRRWWMRKTRLRLPIRPEVWTNNAKHLQLHLLNRVRFIRTHSQRLLNLQQRFLRGTHRLSVVSATDLGCSNAWAHVRRHGREAQNKHMRWIGKTFEPALNGIRERA